MVEWRRVVNLRVHPLQLGSFVSRRLQGEIVGTKEMPGTLAVCRRRRRALDAARAQRWRLRPGALPL